MNKRRRKKGYDAYSIAIVVCVVLITTSLWVIFEPHKLIMSGIQSAKTKIEAGSAKNEDNKSGDSNSNTKKQSTEQDGKISEDAAKDIAVKKFKELGEDVDKESLDIVQLERSKKMYYFVSSDKNTMEVSVDEGKITRVNAVPVKD